MSMGDFLMEVTAKTKQRVEAQRTQVSLDQLEKRMDRSDPHRPFAAALHRSGQLGVIAEFKQASPSAGVIRQETDKAARLSAYARGGAAALSILTEENYFNGSPQFLEEARHLTPLP